MYNDPTSFPPKLWHCNLNQLKGWTDGVSDLDKIGDKARKKEAWKERRWWKTERTSRNQINGGGLLLLMQLLSSMIADDASFSSLQIAAFIGYSTSSATSTETASSGSGFGCGSCSSWRCSWRTKPLEGSLWRSRHRTSYSKLRRRRKTKAPPPRLPRPKWRSSSIW